uniref:Enoyl-CoA hydratase n=1 Tax=Aplanochytrium stocchinoi TaxID=215587 RepID=A0A7S3LM62_9STRA
MSKARITKIDMPLLRLEFVDVGSDDGLTPAVVAIITLNDPKKLNAMSDPMLDSFNEALYLLESGEHNARCLVLTGEGRGFCAGANLTDAGNSNTKNVEQKKPFRHHKETNGVLTLKYHPLMMRLRDLPFPFISVVNGPCAGVGMSFAMAADMMIMADTAYLLQAFRNVGLVPDGGATYLLPRKVGWSRAMELILLGEKVPAEKALAFGLCNYIFPSESLMEEAMKIARKLATGPTKTLGMMRELMWNSFGNTYEQQMFLEAKFQSRAFTYEDTKNVIKAFGTKKKTIFKGK